MEHPENSGEYKGLAVNKGIEQPSSVNPYLKRAKAMRFPDDKHNPAVPADLHNSDYIRHSSGSTNGFPSGY